MDFKPYYLVSLHAFLVASVLYLVYLAVPRSPLLAAARAISFAGLLVHSVPLVLAHVEGNSFVGSEGPFFYILAWAIPATYHAVRVKYAVRLLGLLGAPLATLFTALGLLSEEKPLPAASPHLLWIEAHVVVMSLGVALFAVSAAAGLLYVYQDWRLRNKHAGGGPQMADLETLDSLGRRLLLYGFALLTLGISLGWGAALALGRIEAVRDPLSITFNLVWVLYLALLYFRTAGRIGARQAALLALACYGLALSVMIGVNVWAGSAHYHSHLGLGSP